jgi:hypothetical protein
LRAGASSCLLVLRIYYYGSESAGRGEVIQYAHSLVCMPMRTCHMQHGMCTHMHIAHAQVYNVHMKSNSQCLSYVMRVR